MPPNYTPIFSLLSAVEEEKLAKNGEKSDTFPQKRQISAFPSLFGGRAILKNIYKINFLVYLEIFSLLGAVCDEKMTKT